MQTYRHMRRTWTAQVHVKRLLLANLRSVVAAGSVDSRCTHSACTPCWPAVSSSDDMSVYSAIASGLDGFTCATNLRRLVGPPHFS
jgi:hypothetical protein